VCSIFNYFNLLLVNILYIWFGLFPFNTSLPTFTTHKHKDPNHLWDMFKAEVNRLSTLHIPTRQIKSRADLPWVTHKIVKLIRKRDELYTQLKRSCSHKGHYTEKFKYLKSTIRKQIRNAYWSYLGSVIFSDTQGPGHKKKFNNFVKHKKTEK